MNTLVPPPRNDFDNYNTRELRRLNTDLTIAQQEQAAAQAVTDSLSSRLGAFQKTVAAAQANLSAATANLAAAQSATQTVDKALPLATEAKKQATLIVDLLEPVLEKAHTTALQFIDALQAIDELGAQVARRQGKNEQTSPYIISGTAKLQADAAAGLTALTAALQKTMIAFAAAKEAREASGPVIDSTRRLRKILAPGKPFDPQIPADGGLWPDGKEPNSLIDLANAIRRRDLTVLAVLDSLRAMTAYAANEQQAGATQTALELNTATDTLNRATAKAQSAQASLTAAETAVA